MVLTVHARSLLRKWFRIFIYSNLHENEMKSLFRVILFLAIAIESTTLSYAQDSTSHKKTFFETQVAYLMKEGGEWEAINPKYSKDVKYDAKSFRYQLENGVHAENIRLKINSDVNGVGWYTSWNGYYLWHPLRKEIIYHSLSGNGAIVDGVVTTPDSETRINVFTMMTYSGEFSKHKDVTVQVNENEMHSKSYKMNEKGDWVFNQKLIWRRVNKTN